MRNWLLTQSFYTTPRSKRTRPELITQVLPDLYDEETARKREQFLNTTNNRIRYFARPATETELAERLEMNR